MKRTGSAGRSAGAPRGKAMKRTTPLARTFQRTKSADGPSRIAVVVHRVAGGLVGLAVSRIIDTVAGSGSGADGLVVVRGSVAQVLDPHQWLAGVS